MSADLEIVDDVFEVIEISDDDCLPEDLLNINTSIEPIAKIEIIENESPDAQEELQLNETQDEIANTSNNSSFADASNTVDLCNEIIRIIEDSELTSSVNVAETTQKTNNNSNITSVDKVVTLNNIISRKKMKRKRLKQRKRIVAKNLKNVNDRFPYCGRIPKIDPNLTVIEEESNRHNDMSPQDNYSSNIQQATSNSSITNTSNNKRACVQNYDFSKLHWLKPLSNLSSPAHLQIVIIDRGHPFWRIETESWLMIEKRLLEALHTEILRTNDVTVGAFDGAKWQRGIKIVGCHNETAMEFITKFIINLDKLWRGAKLDAFPITKIFRHIVRIYIPPPILQTDLIMSLIKLQNPTISCEDWKIIREKENPTLRGGVHIWISVDNKSFAQLGALKGELKFGINRIFVNPVE